MHERIDEVSAVEAGALDRAHDEDDVETAAIRADIRETRERMGQTIEEIGERLNPHNVKEQVKHNIREATIGRVEHMARGAADRVNETRRTITDTIRENPVPAAMVGVGLGWLIFSGRRHGPNPVGRQYSYRDAQSYRYGGSASFASGQPADVTFRGGVDSERGAVDRARDRVGDLGEDVKEKAGEIADRAQAAAGQVTARVQGVAGDVAEQTREQAQRLEDRFYENPLAIGAAALALGLAAGLAVPATRKETELMGGARDQLVDRVREAAEETKGKVQHVAERVVDEAQTTAKEAAREEGLAKS